MKEWVANRTKVLTPSLALAIDAKAKQMKAEGQDVVGFGAGDYIRLSYATSMANIQKGLDRIEKFCRALAK